ncbi:hypothetical protein HELRODRAFT_184137 [Helobdella robusta]|uniref:Uncharacterized protein n=1 Tax=Helobdella robusta TaxID=6412 RepID=T1FKN4_HELRO|nr:hypothetical protein HELRODRAFT_184137 [Helobdella robusta]ESO07442.1 hypothetical protein HELRODRAFT_184137 [Helobdella robusta]
MNFKTFIFIVLLSAVLSFCKKFHKKRQATKAHCETKLKIEGGDFAGKIFLENLDEMMRRTQAILDRFYVSEIPDTDNQELSNRVLLNSSRKRRELKCLDVNQRLKILHDSLIDLKSARNVELCMSDLNEQVELILDRLQFARKFIKPRLKLNVGHNFEGTINFFPINEVDGELSTAETCKRAMNVFYNFKSNINLLHLFTYDY